MKKLLSLLTFLSITYFSVAQSLIAHYPMKQGYEDVTGNHKRLVVKNVSFKNGGLSSRDKIESSISTAPIYQLDLDQFGIGVQVKTLKQAEMPVFILGKSCRMIGVSLTQDGFFALTGNNGTIFSKSSKSYQLDKWYNVYVSYDKSSEKAILYINKKKVTEVSFAFETACTNQWKDDNLDISSHDYNGYSFVGVWKNLKVYNGANSSRAPSPFQTQNQTAKAGASITWIKPDEKVSTTKNHYPIEVDVQTEGVGALSGIRIYRNKRLIQSYTKTQLKNQSYFKIKKTIVLHQGDNKIEIHAFIGNRDIKSVQVVNYHVAHNVSSNDINGKLKETTFQYKNYIPFYEGKRYTKHSAMLSPTEDNGSYMGWTDAQGVAHVSKLNSKDQVTKDIILGKNRVLYSVESDETGFVALLVNEKKGTKRDMHWAYLVKYRANGTKVFDKKLFGDNSFTNEGDRAFDDWSTPRVLYTGQHYYVFCGISRKWNDGIVHQGDILFLIDKQGNKVEKRPSRFNGQHYNTNGWSWGTSHSFQQRIAFDGNVVYLIAKGDAYPRGIAYTRVLDNLQASVPSTKGGCVLKMSGALGKNHVPFTLGDVEAVGNNSSIITFAGQKGRKSYDVGFIFVNAQGKEKLRWLTNTSKVDESNVYMTPYGDHYLVAWMAVQLNSRNPANARTKFMAAVIDVDGNFVQKPFEINSQFQGRKIVHENRWSKFHSPIKYYHHVTNDFVTYPNGEVGWVYSDPQTAQIKIVRIKQ
ncbi:MAG: hypothetical protein GY827_12595 [Cytophagales bacterium]|nr:hypothetical protein [Cytophagales bacterium]